MYQEKESSFIGGDINQVELELFEMKSNYPKDTFCGERSVSSASPALSGQRLHAFMILSFAEPHFSFISVMVLCGW
jgi:hypothetical protein